MHRLIEKNSQLLRFGAVGGINTVIDFSLLFLLRSLGLPAVGANIISSTTAFIFSFVANKKYTFKSSGTNLKRELFLFTAVTLFGLWVLQSGVIWLVTPILEASGLHSSVALFFAKLLATIVSLSWNYILYSRVVFVKD